MVVLNTTQTVNGVVPECLCRVQGDIEVHICELFHLATCVEHVPQRQVTQIHISYCAVRFQWLGQWSIEFQAIHMDHCLIEGNSPIFFTVLWLKLSTKVRDRRLGNFRCSKLWLKPPPSLKKSGLEGQWWCQVI